MAQSILDKYGIKEVADFTFYEIKDNGDPGNPVLYLDTLKVSTVEQTAETAEARGGKGNPPLIVWDYGKEINITLEDALFSAKSMATMFGNGNTPKTITTIRKTFPVTWTTAITNTIEVPTGNQVIKVPNTGKYYKADGSESTTAVATAPPTSEDVYYTVDLEVAGQEITISSETFPGTYYCTGDTYARSEITGKDEFFQFIVPKAKILSENTITLEAEGDPSVFNMNLRVMRNKNKEMMKLVQYSITEGE